MQSAELNASWPINRQDTVFAECIHIGRVSRLAKPHAEYECPVRADQSDHK